MMWTSFEYKLDELNLKLGELNFNFVFHHVDLKKMWNKIQNDVSLFWIQICWIGFDFCELIFESKLTKFENWWTEFDSCELNLESMMKWIWTSFEFEWTSLVFREIDFKICELKFKMMWTSFE